VSGEVAAERLAVGDRVKFAEEAQRYTVRAVTRGGRFAICTKPFNPRRTVLYSVIDFRRGVRGRDNYYGLGYESDEDIASALHQFQHTEDEDPPEVTNDCEFDGGWCHGGAEVSGRTANHITLRIESVIHPEQDRP
jgi:hypothetical protein